MYYNLFNTSIADGAYCIFTAFDSGSWYTLPHFIDVATERLSHFPSARPVGGGFRIGTWICPVGPLRLVGGRESTGQPGVENPVTGLWGQRSLHACHVG